MHGYNTCYENGEVVEEGVFLNGKLYTDINHVKKKIKKMKKVWFFYILLFGKFKLWKFKILGIN